MDFQFILQSFRFLRGGGREVSYNESGGTDFCEKSMKTAKGA
jgi:hypothetical protein